MRSGSDSEAPSLPLPGLRPRDEAAPPPASPLDASLRDAASRDEGPLRNYAEPPSFLAIVFLILSSVILYALGPEGRGASAKLAMALALVSMVSQLVWLRWLKRPYRTHAHRHLALYFVVQLALDVAAVALSEGNLSFIVLAVASQAVLFWPWRRSVLVLVPAIGAPVVMVAFVRSELVGQFIISFGSIVAFVVTFSSMLARQYDARDENARLATALGEANQELERNAAVTGELATMRERTRLAREIHDVLGHYLTAVHVHMNAAENLLDRDPARTRELIGKARDMTHRGLNELRSSVSVLRDHGERASLDEAIRGLLHSQSTPELAIEISVEGSPRRSDPASELALYRAAQETLTNARRHSGASEIRFTLSFREDLHLVVEDNGRGAEALALGHGLEGIEERIAQLGGRVKIETRPGDGFRVSIEVPS